MYSQGVVNKIALQVAERIRDLSTIEGRCPFLTGDLRKSIQVQLTGPGESTVSSNLAYARAVHDGRKAITIRPKKAKMLSWQTGGSGRTSSGNKRGKGNKQIKWAFAKEVHQPAREGQPFLLEGAADMQSRGYDFLDPLLNEYVSAEIGEQIKDSIELNFSV